MLLGGIQGFYRDIEFFCTKRYRICLNGNNMNDTESGYSDYIVYVDESGDHSLESINPRYPLFVLVFCVFRKDHYAQKVIPALTGLKMTTFGHELIVLHEQEIRKKTGAFNKLGLLLREKLMEALSGLMVEIDFILIPIIVDKYALKEMGPDPTHVYHLAMQLGLEKLFKLLRACNQQNRLTHVIFEARGRCEDLALELEFLHICTGHNSLKQKLLFEIVVADKKTNSVGLQIADMAARPIGLSVLRPDQPNRAFAILEGKLYQEGKGQTDSFIFPIKAKGPKVDLEAQTPVG